MSTSPTEVPTQTASPHEKFFQGVRDSVKTKAGQDPVLLNIPVWGYQGSGKTCSILTAYHFIEPQKHGIGFALVKDPDILLDFEERAEEYRGMGLATLAETTRARLDELNERFITDSEWPHGTDLPTHYLLEIRSVSRRLGFVLLPDIKGGSYEMSDQVAKNALKNAHAVIALVEPSKYRDKNPRGKEYRDDILGIVQKCAEEHVPICVMISKSDQWDNDAARVGDSVHEELTSLLAQQSETDENYRVIRTSVIGEAKGARPERPNAPPPIQDRQPNELVLGWVWAAKMALEQPREEVVERIPNTNISMASARQPRLQITDIPELRVVRHQGGCPGTVVCSTRSSPSSSDFLLLDDKKGELVEVSFDLNNNYEPQFRGARVSLESWDPDIEESLEVYVTTGALFAGLPATDRIWYGPKGQSLALATFPYPMEAWVPLSDRRLVGIAENGNLHSLIFGDGKWTAGEYSSDFIVPASNLALTYAQGLLSAHNGVSATSIHVTEKGGFGARAENNVQMTYNTSVVEMNTALFVVTSMPDGALIGGREKQLSLGQVDPSNPMFALAQDEEVVAWVTPNSELHAATISDDDFQVAVRHAALDNVPSSMRWGRNGDLLLLTFSGGRWAWARRFGF